MFNIKKHQRTIIKTVRGHCTPIKTAKMRKTGNPKCWQNVEEWELARAAGGNTDGDNQFRSQCGNFLIIEHWGPLFG